MLLAALLLAAQAVAQQVSVKAMGFAKDVTGGDGFLRHQVTTLEDDGPGSLRAVLAIAPRNAYINIARCGTIKLNSRLSISGKNITIDGSQCQGGAGVQIINYPVTLWKAENIVLTNLAFRLGDQAIKSKGQGQSSDALEIGCSQNILVDHASIYWGMDENLSIFCYEKNKASISTNITVQNSIIAEGLNSSAKRYKKSHSMGVLISGTVGNVTFYRNLFVSNGDRNVQIGASPYAHVASKTRIQFINNMLYQTIYGTRTGSVSAKPWVTEIDLVGNFQKPAKTKFSIMLDTGASIAVSEKPLYMHREDNRQPVFAYLHDNLGVTRQEKNQPEEDVFRYYRYPVGKLSVLAAENSRNFMLSQKPLSDFSGIHIVAANALEKILLNGVGKVKPCRDPIDLRVINNVLNDVPAERGGQKPVDTPADVGGFHHDQWQCGA